MRPCGVWDRRQRKEWRRTPLMRGRAQRTGFGPHFGRHHALRPGPEADQDELAGPQLGNAEPAQGLHMDENVRRALAAREEAKTAKPIEPFHLCPFETACRGHSNMG